MQKDDTHTELIMKEIEIPKKGKLPISVNKDVVKHLSLGLYRNFALAIKEIISNSYDAGAKEVKIKLDLKNNKIIIRDDGDGMNYAQLRDEYLHIGFYKEPSKSPNKLGRMRIGTFGIGFLSPLPYCSKMTIITKKKGEGDVITSTIDAKRLFKPGTWEIQEEQIPYVITKSDLPKSKGETIIILEGIPTQIQNELKREHRPGKYKLDQLGGFEKFKWTLCQFVPIEFPKDEKEIKNFFTNKNTVPMKVWLDGKQLFRNVPENTKILERNTEKFDGITVKYAIMGSYVHPIKPEEARGLQIRLRDVAIGFPTTFDVTKLGRVLGKLNFICGEVHVTKGLDNALMVSRDTFSYTKEVAKIFEFFRNKLTRWNDVLYHQSSVDKEIYESLGDLAEDQKIVGALKEAEMIHFGKERLRMQGSSITKIKKTTTKKTSEKIANALSKVKKKGYKIITKKGRVPASKPPLNIQHNKKSIIIYENHPAFAETVNINNRKFEVSYGEWDPHIPYSICKLDNREKIVIFNIAHPLFKSKLSDTIIKKLSLGIVLILKDKKDGEMLIAKINRLLEETF